MKTYVIICSVNRPEVLHETVESILKQQQLPERILLSVGCDEDVLPATRELPLVDVRVAPVKGLTAQRNYGVDCIPSVQNDLIAFLDDDVELDPQFLDTMSQLFEQDTKIIGLSAETLVGGRMVPRAEAQATLSKLTPLPFEELTVRSTGKHWICHGCNMTFRASLFEQERFDEALPLYSYAEDYDFSIRAARHGIVGRVAGVGFVHLEHSSGRVSEKRRGYSIIANNYYFLKKGVCHLPRWKGYIRFWLVIALKETARDQWNAWFTQANESRDFQGCVHGRLQAITDILTGNSKPEKILKMT